MAKFRKKPIVVEAIKYTGENATEISDFAHNGWVSFFNSKDTIQTLGGPFHLSVGDFVVKGVNGKFYLCKPDIFEKTYEELKLIEEW